ncbi:MAG: FAD-dependent oxidoreductase [Anaeromyxobacteraceae bacterium]|nr:FAD-dependent oxidoreductase [Anaeromyxobacteraceae bacterium]
MRIAIVGSGIAGLCCAHLLDGAHEVTLYEAGDHVGGHTHTHDLAVGGQPVRVDTGFIVFNEETYPGFVKLLARLGVASQPSDMSFSVKDAKTGLEWNGHSLDSLFAQRSNVLNPRFYRMVADILRFNTLARALAVAEAPIDETIGAFVARHGFGRPFVEQYLVPIGTAVWSADPTRFEEFPAQTFCRFFENHRFLQLSDQPTWRTVKGGSDTYVRAILAGLRGAVVRAAVTSVRRDADGRGALEVTAAGLPPARFDRVVLACHSDEALRLLADPTPLERAVLGAIPYQENVATLHTDAGVMPAARRAWASWNAWVPPAPRGRATLTYDMNRLQSLVTPEPLLVSLNMDDVISPSKVIRRMTYHHPVYTPESVQAQRRHGEIDGVGGTHFCGAYWSYGFHEDGVQSALRVCRKLGRDL